MIKNILNPKFLNISIGSYDASTICSPGLFGIIVNAIHANKKDTIFIYFRTDVEFYLSFYSIE